ncbi:MAG: magnesium transporter CorA family protein [Elusimicrobiales bacterium]|nr:magnesium transporter CorA family protein [Elusimicrobiales bacterium]
MIKYYKIEQNQIIETKDKAKIIVLINPTQEEKDYITQTFNIDQHNINSSLDPEEPARLEFEQDKIELIFKRPKNYSSKDHYLFKVSSIGLFLLKNILIIVLNEDINIFSGKYFKHVIGIREIFLKIIYNSIYHFIEHLKVINMIADEIETKIAKSMDNKYLIHMFTLEKSLVYYTSAITSNGYALEKLRIISQRMNFSERSIEYLEDIFIENSQAKNQADIYLQVFSSLMDARASIINNNMNIWLKSLTIITIAIAVPNYFASIGGMSELTAFLGVESVRVAFGIFFVFSLICALLIFWIFKKLEEKGTFTK